ncbi:MAG: hypothetical protein A2Y24_01115 [Clostridiales bacterium GWE2_32_10]|nr:MAG: hypothetical protein A2Y24_01115 [Clostridiales bacterium GWE2_32_10]HBY21213.1 hypothetical protein [Clostridiales bacterium]
MSFHMVYEISRKQRLFVESFMEILLGELEVKEIPYCMDNRFTYGVEYIRRYLAHMFFEGKLENKTYENITVPLLLPAIGYGLYEKMGDAVNKFIIDNCHFDIDTKNGTFISIEHDFGSRNDEKGLKADIEELGIDKQILVGATVAFCEGAELKYTPPEMEQYDDLVLD